MPFTPFYFEVPCLSWWADDSLQEVSPWQSVIHLSTLEMPLAFSYMLRVLCCESMDHLYEVDKPPVNHDHTQPFKNRRRKNRFTGSLSEATGKRITDFFNRRSFMK